MSVYPRFSEKDAVTSWIIDESTSDAAVNSLLQMIHLGSIFPARYNHAAIRYDCFVGLSSDPEDDAHYALVFSSTKNDVPPVYVGCVTAGYGGSGPHATLQCLELMDFILSDSEKEQVTSKPLVKGEPYPVIRIDFFKKAKRNNPFTKSKPPDDNE